MKSAEYVAKMFKGFEVYSHEVLEDQVHIFRLGRIKNRGNGPTCRYVICLEPRYPWEFGTPAKKIQRELEQAKELVKALDALPRY